MSQTCDYYILFYSQHACYRDSWLQLYHYNLCVDRHVLLILFHGKFFKRNKKLNTCVPSSTKNTILKKYDGRFKDLFEEIYEKYILIFRCDSRLLIKNICHHTEYWCHPCNAQNVRIWFFCFLPYLDCLLFILHLSCPLNHWIQQRLQDEVRSSWYHLRASSHRRHGRSGDEVGRRIRLGLQELWRRRPVRLGSSRSVFLEFLDCCSAPDILLMFCSTIVRKIVVLTLSNYLVPCCKTWWLKFEKFLY